MRTFDEIRSDINAAIDRNNAEALWGLADEMQALETPNAHVAALNSRGQAAAMTGNYPLALEHYRLALERYEEQDYRLGIAYIIGNIALVYAKTGDYPAALEHQNRALALYEELGDQAEVARVTGNMGTIYSYTGNYLLALEHYRRSKRVAMELGDRSGEAATTGNMGNVYRKIGDHGAALDHYRHALALHEQLGNRSSVALVTGNLISALLDTDQYDEAAAYLDRQVSMRMDDPVVHAEHKANRATLAKHRGDLDATHGYLVEAMTIATDAGLRDKSAEYHFMLRELAEQRNDFADYIKHNNEYQRLTEEINGKLTAQKMTMIDAEKRIAAERAEKDKHRTLLYNTLPPSIANRVLHGETVNDAFENAAVLFMDMVGFTTMSSTMNPNDVVRLLSEIFTAIDAIMNEHGVMKIKTIGDSYMAVAFANGEQQAAQSALSILQVMTDRFPQVQVRIGLHCGPVTAGVIGTERLQYDVWGDTVNVASRMESTGQPGRIHVSEAFAHALTRLELETGATAGADVISDAPYHDFTLTERGTINVKGKGAMTTFWLERDREWSTHSRFTINRTGDG